jgi:hypothetical protein
MDSRNYGEERKLNVDTTKELNMFSRDMGPLEVDQATI